MLVSSRSLAEYRAFFALDSLDGRAVLDCAAGASGFTASARREGARACAVDVAYADPVEDLIAAAEHFRAAARGIVDANDDRFRWDFYGGRPGWARLREEGLAAFVEDLREHPGHYVAGDLRALPFRYRAFDLALCSHLLFTWSPVFDEAWHRAAIAEMLRVAREVRIFPLVQKDTAIRG